MGFISRIFSHSVTKYAFLIIVLSIPATVFLTQQRQDLQQSASGNATPTLAPGCYYKPIACAEDEACNPVVVCPVEDLNKNGEPDLPDYNKLVECINSPAGCPPTVDLNGDGITDEIDLNQLLREMNKSDE